MKKNTKIALLHISNIIIISIIIITKIPIFPAVILAFISGYIHSEFINKTERKYTRFNKDKGGIKKK